MQKLHCSRAPVLIGGYSTHRVGPARNGEDPENDGRGDSTCRAGPLDEVEIVQGWHGWHKQRGHNGKIVGNDVGEGSQCAAVGDEPLLTNGQDVRQLCIAITASVGVTVVTIAWKPVRIEPMQNICAKRETPDSP